jgi:hypothetical protein
MNMSPAMELILLIWKRGNSTSTGGWRSIMSSAVLTAVRSNLKFDSDDDSDVFGQSYCHPSTIFDYTGESFYTTACETPNMSACQLYEKAHKRKPFLIKGKRLHVGMTVYIDSMRYEVTSFNHDQKLVLCEYSFDYVGYAESKYIDGCYWKVLDKEECADITTFKMRKLGSKRPRSNLIAIKKLDNLEFRELVKQNKVEIR